MSSTATTGLVGERGSIYFHDNIWKEDLVLSLNSPYLDSKYVSQLETTVEEIKNMIRILAPFQSNLNQTNHSNADVYECLQVVDVLQALAVGEYFTEEIKNALDYVHRFWDESKGIICSSKNSNEHSQLFYNSLAFRLFRIHGYAVTPRAMETFKTVDSSTAAETKIPKTAETKVPKTAAAADEETHVKSILNLFRASGLYFPQDSILQEAEDFSSEFLRDWLQHIDNKQHGHGSEQSLPKEVKFVLDYPWYNSPTLWNARNYIDIYQSNHDWLRSRLNEKILKLAKLTFNIKQAIHQKEMKDLMTWWRENVPKASYMRFRPMECYFFAALNIPEPEYGDARFALAKSYMLAYALDDTADNYATFTEFKLFYEALEQEDLLKVEMESYPEQVKEVLKFTIATINEIALKASKKQGRDMKPYVKKVWMNLVRAYLHESEWNEEKYFPSFEEYLNKNVNSSGVGLLSVNSLVFMDASFDLDKYSCIFNLEETLIRVADDFGDFKDPKKQDQLVNLVQCYLIHNPHASLEDGLSYMKGLILKKWQEINLWYFSDSNLLNRCRTFCYEICRVIFFVLSTADGFTFTDTKIKHQMMKMLVLPA